MSLPTDKNGNQFISDSSTGNSFVVIEKYSGNTLQLQSSLQTNFQVWPDSLFMFPQTSSYGQFVPNVFILKQSTLSSSTLQQLLGYQGSIRTTEWVLFGVCLGVGIITLAIGAFLLLRFLKARKLAEIAAR